MDFTLWSSNITSSDFTHILLSEVQLLQAVAAITPHSTLRSSIITSSDKLHTYFNF